MSDAGSTSTQEDIVVSSRVNAIASEAYAGWFSEGATIEEMRAGFDDMCPAPSPGVTVTAGAVGGIPGAWVSVPESGDTVILHFHGGGYMLGSPTSHRDLAGRIAGAAGARAFLPHFRLAPENPFPAAFDDGVAAYNGLLRPAERRSGSRLPHRLGRLRRRRAGPRCSGRHPRPRPPGTCCWGPAVPMGGPDAVR